MGASRVIRKHYEAHDEAQKKRVQKGARGAAQQPKRVALHRRRLHARKQTVLGRKKSKLHAVFACDSETLGSARCSAKKARLKVESHL